MNAIYVGTSGWSYKGWEKEFYPSNLPRTRQLEFYMTQFPSVEINATFYRLPTQKMVRNWRDTAPKNFVFAVKGSRYITHMKKLAALSDAVEKFFGRIKPLGKLTGPILWQLPPFLKKDITRLDDFLAEVPSGYRSAVEFRHESWLDDNVFDVLNRHDAALVAVSSQKFPVNLTVTSDFLYVRFHGLEGGPQHDYSREELQPWAEYIHKNAQAHRCAYVYFNNDLNVRAPANAKLLMEMVGKNTVQALPPSDILNELKRAA